MKRIIGIFILLIAILSLSSCYTTNGGKTRTYGDFKYKVNYETDEIMLIGLSSKGEKTDTLIVPTMIGNRKVTTIGYKKDYFLDDGTGVWYASFIGVYTKLYIHSFINTAKSNTGSIVNLREDLNIYYGMYFVGDNNLIISEYPENYYIAESEKGKNDYVIPSFNSANVVYYLNYTSDSNDTFFVDDCSGTTVNVIPPDPYRDGYKFMGWYKEKECINSFDFENDIIPEKQYDTDNNYIFEETSLYAKWEQS